MASFGSPYTASPVLTMTPQSAHQNPFDRPTLFHQSSSFDASASWSQTPIANTCSVAGRKRSRDEAAVNLDPPEKIVEPPIIEEESEDEWVYGPGMTLIKKNSGYVADAGSQSGTWLEEKAAEEATRKAEAAALAQDQLAQQRPSLRSNKSQRLEMSSLSSLPATEGFQSNRSSPSRDIANPMATSTDGMAQPVVDDFTLHLGIGWSRISEDEHIQAAARGWARYIENHYAINDVKIRLESRGLQSYLVEANEGFFLFGEDLKQGRLVSTDPTRALQNLATSPPTFDGSDTLNATETPKPMDAGLDFSTAVTTATTTDMDMS